MPRAEGRRSGPWPREDEDPPGALLGRAHPARALAASRSRDRAEPEARPLQAPRLPGQAGRRTPVAPAEIGWRLPAFALVRFERRDSRFWSRAPIGA
jgi:hypothetical protein